MAGTKKLHSSFKLNGHSFVSESALLLYSKSLSSSTSIFLENWLNTKMFVVVTTSGSTGKAKQISLKKKHMIRSAEMTGAYFKLYEESSALLCLSTDYIAGKMMLVRAMVLGWHLDIVAPSSNPLALSAKSFDFCAMVPLQLQNSIPNIEKVRTLIVGGGQISKPLEQQIQKVPTIIYASYGMTETCTHVALKKINNFLNGNYINFYETLPDIKAIIDERGCLVIEAPTLADIKIRTNDLIELISDSKFIWKGRIDNVINSGGIKLIPEQIEATISQVLDKRFFVAGIPDEQLGEKLILIIESTIEIPLLESKIKNLGLLTNYELPKKIIFVPKFMETKTNKIHRKKTLDSIIIH